MFRVLGVWVCVWAGGGGKEGVGSLFGSLQVESPAQQPEALLMAVGLLVLTNLSLNTHAHIQGEKQTQNYRAVKSNVDTVLHYDDHWNSSLTLRESHIHYPACCQKSAILRWLLSMSEYNFMLIQLKSRVNQVLLAIGLGLIELKRTVCSLGLFWYVDKNRNSLRQIITGMKIHWNNITEGILSFTFVLMKQQKKKCFWWS